MQSQVAPDANKMCICFMAVFQDNRRLTYVQINQQWDGLDTPKNILPLCFDPYRRLGRPEISL